VAPVTATADLWLRSPSSAAWWQPDLVYGLLLDLSGVLNWGEAINNLRDGRLRD
jgi:hypothetical protein